MVPMKSSLLQNRAQLAMQSGKQREHKTRSHDPHDQPAEGNDLTNDGEEQERQPLR